MCMVRGRAGCHTCVLGLQLPATKPLGVQMSMEHSSQSVHLVQCSAAAVESPPRTRDPEAVGHCRVYTPTPAFCFSQERRVFAGRNSVQYLLRCMLLPFPLKGIKVDVVITVSAGGGKNVEQHHSAEFFPYLGMSFEIRCLSPTQSTCGRLHGVPVVDLIAAMQVSHKKHRMVHTNSAASHCPHTIGLRILARAHSQ